MEEERILNNILKKESRQLQDVKNYTANLEKILSCDPLKHIQKKPSEYEALCKYGVFCMKLLRYCVEALSKGKNQVNGIHDDCFKCAELGADVMSRLFTSGITLPPNISVSGTLKLFFHLIVAALKSNNVNHLLHITRSLLNIMQMTVKSGEENFIKDSTALCKQIADHLWNAAIKLPKNMDKLQKACLALSLREHSVDLLIAAKLDLGLIISRGLQAGRQFQLEVVSERKEGQLYFLSLLRKVVALLDNHHDESMELYSQMEDLCINCCKLITAPSHFQDLLQSFNRVLGKETKRSVIPQKRSHVFQSIIQILLCALCFRLRDGKELENYQYDFELKWSSIQKRLAHTSEVIRKLDSNVSVESQICPAINYLRYTLSSIFRDNPSETSFKIPAEVLPVLEELLVCCYNIQSDMVQGSTWETVVQPKLALLHLISTVHMKNLKHGIVKKMQNGRRLATERDYTSVMVDGMKLLDCFQDLPMVVDQYLHYAMNAFNIGVMLYNCDQINEATSLARLSSEAAYKWYSSQSDASKAVTKASLHKKYKLLSDCLEKQDHWLESVRAMTLCCQYYVMSINELSGDDRAMQYVMIWSSRKHTAMKKFEKNVDQCNLDDGCRGVNAPNLDQEQVCTLLRMELDSYKEKRYCSMFDQLSVVEKLFNIYESIQDETNALLMRFERVKIMYHIAEDVAGIRAVLHNCEELITLVSEIEDSVMTEDILASAYFWRFVLQYSLAVQLAKENTNEENKEAWSFERTTLLSLTPDFLISLHSAVNGWTELINQVVTTGKKIDIYCQSETCWMLQMASSVYGFLDMPLVKIHTLLVLATLARECQNNETAVMASSLAVQDLCREANVSGAEVLCRDCENMTTKLDENCISGYFFSLAKSQLLLSKGMYDEGWEIVKAVLGAVNENRIKERSIKQFILIKTKILCAKYLSLPSSLCETSLEDGEKGYFEFLLDSSKHAEMLVDHFVDSGVKCLQHLKKERAVFLSHWSLLDELRCCFLEIGKVYLVQGAVREAKRYFKDGSEIARQYLSAKGYAEFSIQLAELCVVLEQTEQCKAHLEDAISIVQPNLSLDDILGSFKLEEDESVFVNYDIVSASQLQLRVVNCCCKYLSGDVSEVSKVVSFSHDLRHRSVERYTRALDDLECVFASYKQRDERLSGKAKGRSQRGKTKRSQKETKEFITCKADIAALVFLESALKVHALDGDNALKEGDFSRLLSNVQAGLHMIQWAQSIVSDPFLLDFMSTSLLHYLQGVVHVLASKTGFDSWRVAGCPSPPGTKNPDVGNLSEVMSKLDLSLDQPVKSRRGVKKKKRDELFGDSFDMDDDQCKRHFENEVRRGRTNQTERVTRAKRKADASSKVLAEHKEPQSQEDAAEVPSTKKSSRSCKKLSEDVRGSNKPRRNSNKNSSCNDLTRASEKDARRKCQSQYLLEQREEEHFDGRNVITTMVEEDEEMKYAVDSFTTSLKYLHPCFNPMILNRICQALVLSYGLNFPHQAAVYQNMAMATTIRHQTLHRSSKKIRDEKKKRTRDANQEDDLLQTLESTSSNEEHRKNVKQKLHLQTFKNSVGFKISEAEQDLENIIESLPKDLTVCMLSIVDAPDRNDMKSLVISRLRNSNEPLVVKLALPNDDDVNIENETNTDSVVRDLTSLFCKNILSDFAEIIQKSNDAVTVNCKKEWWNKRQHVDSQLKSFVKRMEETWFGRWRGILNGRALDDEHRSRLHSNVEEIQRLAMKILGSRVHNQQLLEVLIDSCRRLTPSEIMKALSELTGLQENCDPLLKLCKAVSDVLGGNEREDDTDCIARGPVVLVLGKTIQHLPFESMPILRDQEVSRMPSLEFIAAHLSLQKMTMSGVDTRQTFYILNPQDNLPNTEKRFSHWFSSEKEWKGVVGRAPSTSEFKEALGDHELFIYMGHGNGREFLKGDEISRLYCQAVAVLMGCSSGKLIVEGQCDARGMALNYLLSGSPAVIGNLWDVTDVDTDKFSTNLLRTWFKEGHQLSLTRCVVRSRKVYNMKYINGAAPIVYGMPHVYTRP